MPKALGEDGEMHPDELKSIQYEKRRQIHKKRRGGDRKSVKDWINDKKKVAREKGKKAVANDSKFTGRKRKVRF